MKCLRQGYIREKRLGTDSLYKMTQNKVTKMKSQSRHRKRIKNHIATSGRKSHLGPLEGSKLYVIPEE